MGFIDTATSKCAKHFLRVMTLGLDTINSYNVLYCFVHESSLTLVKACRGQVSVSDSCSALLVVGPAGMLPPRLASPCQGSSIQMTAWPPHSLSSWRGGMIYLLGKWERNSLLFLRICCPHKHMLSSAPHAVSFTGQASCR